MTDYYDRCPECGGIMPRGGPCRHCAQAAKGPAHTQRETLSTESPANQASPPHSSVPRPPKSTSVAKIMILVPVIIFLLIAVTAIVWGTVGTLFGDDETVATAAVPTTTIYAVDQIEILSRSTKFSNEDGYIVIHGEVRNTGSLAVTYVALRGYAQESSGATVNTNTSYIDSDVLAPGGTATFSIYLDDPGNDARRARVEVESAYFQD